MQAIKETHDIKGVDKNTRAVAGAVAVAASDLGASQENALKWSKTLAEHYIKKPADFNKLDYKAKELCPGLTDPMAQTLVNAAQAAAGVPAKADALKAGTSVAAKTYPTFDQPQAAAAMATVIAEAHNGNSSAKANASAYAEKLVERARADYAHFSKGAAAAAAATQAAAYVTTLQAPQNQPDPYARNLVLIKNDTTINILERNSPEMASIHRTIDLACPDTQHLTSDRLAIAAHVSVTAKMLGMTDAQTNTATLAAIDASTRKKEDLAPAISVALASDYANESWGSASGMAQSFRPPGEASSWENRYKVLSIT